MVSPRHSWCQPLPTGVQGHQVAWQHKVPVQRSAFNYCEDDLPSGLDLGKSKYGGPFTTEQVEDVKSFYEVLKVI